MPASNRLGRFFTITTWGESHGKAIGVVVDGCPPGLPLTTEVIQKALNRRVPGKGPYTSPRAEKDQVQILSGIFEAHTTGAPISLLIPNTDVRSEHYHPMRHTFRPGHANFTYLQKYGHYDYRGSGRASARETACRVAASAIAELLLEQHGIQVSAYLKSVGSSAVYALPAVYTQQGPDLDFGERIDQSSVYCPDTQTEQAMLLELESAMAQGDSVGGQVGFLAWGLPVGLGDPVYDKLEALLAAAMLSIPASKGFEIGLGFASACYRGSEHNDRFIKDHAGTVRTETNHAGGTLGGISCGMPVWGAVAFKPTSSIKKPQTTVDASGEACKLVLPAGSRHDPCVAIRAVPVVRAMLALVLADALLASMVSSAAVPAALEASPVDGLTDPGLQGPPVSV